MRKFKTILALALALAVIASFSVAAFAEPIDVDSHQFKAFQIFSGNEDPNDETGALGNVQWGDGINVNDFLTDLKGSTEFGDPNPFIHDDTAADVARHLGEVATDDSAAAIAFSKLAYKWRITSAGIDVVNYDTGLLPGYYLVVDVTDISEDDYDAYNMALLQQTGRIPFEIRAKSDVPELVKKVLDVNDSEAGEGVWQDSADYDIGDNVPFRITVKLADFSNYDSYDICVNDTLSSGLTFNRGSVVIKINNTIVTEHFNVVGQNQSLKINNIDDVKTFADPGATITFEYTARLNESAVKGYVGNDNTAYLEFSNNPNDSDSKGTTPPDLVRVFTYFFVVNKTNEDGDALVGATFRLDKQMADGSWKQLNTIRGTNKSTFQWDGLDDGNYRLVELQAPAGYNVIEPVEFTVSANHEAEADSPKLLELTVASQTASFTVVKDTNNNYTGEFDTTVVDEAGVVLPETGEEGTQMLYILGSILLLGGIILIVTRKRAGGIA